MDIILRNARLIDGREVDIAVADGIITDIAPELTASAKVEHDASGQLALPAFVNGQLHACKVFWRRKLKGLPTDIQALPRFEAAKHVKATYTPEDVASRVSEVVRLAVLNGTCALRLFADVDEASGLNALKGLLEVTQNFASILPIQVVAFPQDGVGGKTEQLMVDALELGADVVGGIPWIEVGDEAKREHTEMCFELAKRFDKDLHLVADDTTDAESETLEHIANTTIQSNYHGRVSVTQCAALSFYDDGYAKIVIDKVKQAGLTVFSNSHVSLVTTENEGEPYPRGITRIRELQAAGVPVACAQDDIDNWYYPFGRNDMLEVAQFMAHNGAFAWQGEVNQVLPMVTDIPARVLGLEGYGLRVGCAANIVLLNALTWHEAIQFQPAKSLVILGGQVRARSQRQEDIIL
ncbi:MAG: amidohydrolase family protein [Deinococcota bacterium]